MADSANIELIAQRLQVAEKTISDANRKIEDLQRANAKLEGQQAQQDRAASSAQKWGPWALGLVITLVGFISGTFIFDRIDSNLHRIEQVEIANAERFTRKDQRLKNLEARKPTSITGVLSRLTTEEAATQRLILGIDEHEEEIDALEDRTGAIENNISSIRASTQASLAEVETQIRATTEVINVQKAAQERLNQLLWKKAYGDNLPDNEFFPQNIPAKATTEVGKINGE